MSEYTIVGEKYLDRFEREEWFALKHGSPLTLQRVPTPPERFLRENPGKAWDANAIRVLSREIHVGYIRSAEAQQLAPWLDQYGQHAIVHYEKPNKAKITVARREPAADLVMGTRHGDDPGASS